MGTLSTYLAPGSTLCSGAWNSEQLPRADPPPRLQPIRGLRSAPGGPCWPSGAVLTQTDQRRLHEATRPSLRDDRPGLEWPEQSTGRQGTWGASTKHRAPSSLRGWVRLGAGFCIVRDQLDFLRHWLAFRAWFPRTGKT